STPLPSSGATAPTTTTAAATTETTSAATPEAPTKSAPRSPIETAAGPAGHAASARRADGSALTAGTETPPAQANHESGRAADQANEKAAEGQAGEHGDCKAREKGRHHEGHEGQGDQGQPDIPFFVSQGACSGGRQALA